MTTPSIRLDTTVLDKIARNSGENVRKTLKRFTYKLANRARMGAPVKTGFLRSSIEEDFDQLDSDNKGIVNVFAEYGLYQELGTHTMAAHPYMKPAADETAAELETTAEWEGLWTE